MRVRNGNFQFIFYLFYFDGFPTLGASLVTTVTTYTKHQKKLIKGKQITRQRILCVSVDDIISWKNFPTFFTEKKTHFIIIEISSENDSNTDP